ncbi:MAG: CPBP family intramembrane glutamate endopeptidase, partial [Terrimesophilobacter sp.]
MTQVSTATVSPREALSWKLPPAMLLSGSAVLLFGFESDVAGYSVLAAGLITALVVDREFARHVALIAIGLVIISAVPLNADLSIRHMLLMGGALALAVVVPYAISRFGYRDHLVRFPVLTGRRWPTVAKL